MADATPTRPRFHYETIPAGRVSGEPLNYRITDSVGDDRIATCYDAQNAERVTRQLNLGELAGEMLAALEFCRSVLAANPVEMSERMAIAKADAAIAKAKEPDPC